MTHLSCFRHRDLFRAILIHVIIVLLTVSVPCILAGCVPPIPKVEQPTGHIPLRNMMAELGPLNITLSSHVTLESDARGWYCWQNKPRSPFDIILLPIICTGVLPFTLYFGSYNTSHFESYIRQVTEEMNIQDFLRNSVLTEMRKSFPSGVADSTDGAGTAFTGKMINRDIRTVLELTAVKVYLDNAGRIEKSSAFTIIIESRWLLGAADGSNEYGRFHEVTEREIVPVKPADIPYELFLCIDAHAQEIVKRLANDSH